LPSNGAWWSTTTAGAHVNGELAAGVGVGDADVVGVGVAALEVGVALGGIEDLACGVAELPHAVRINMTARTAALM
jgi:hypothetical protein